MHALKFTTAELNVFCRALDTLAEQSTVLKENLMTQVAAEQEAARLAAEKPKAKK